MTVAREQGYERQLCAACSREYVRELGDQHTRCNLCRGASVIEVIEGEVVELANRHTALGNFIQVRIEALGDSKRRMNVWMPPEDVRGLALGTRVRVQMEVCDAKP